MDSQRRNLYYSDMSLSPIQNFNLFGEAGDLPDVVHCETIEARSTLHDWEFSPHRHARLHQVLLLESGGGQALLDGARQPLEAGLFVNVPTGAVHGFSFLPDTQGWVVTLGSEVLDEILQDGEGVIPMLKRPFIGKSSPEMKGLMQDIFCEYRARNFARAHILRALSGHLAGLAARQIHLLGSTRTGQDTPLLNRFNALLEARFTQHLPITDYASALAVSPTHLSRVVRTATGQPVSKLIEARLIREARRMLAYTNLSVSQVAYALGYIDPAYFSRVFARATGLAPRRFRARLETGG